MKEREYGIDVLRIISMYLVIVVHIFNIGGALVQVDFFSKKYISVSLLRIIANCAVDLFALISGYVGYKAQIRFKKLFSIWGSVLFYSVGITLFFFLAGYQITGEQWIGTFFPVLTDEYWYFSSYVIVFFLAPFIRNAIDTIQKRELEIIVVCLLLLTSVAQIIFKSYDAFDLEAGYSALWLLILYILGIYTKRYRPLSNLKIKTVMMIAIGFILVSWIISTMLAVLSYHFTGRVRGYNIFDSYTSPTVVGFAFFLVLLFSRITISRGRRLIVMLSVHSFGVYLIHIHPLINAYYFDGSFKRIGNYPALMITLIVLVSAACIYLGCSAIEILRANIFRIIRKVTHIVIRKNRKEMG